MAWEPRRQRSYYYRGYRDGERIRKKYFGNHVAAVAAAKEDMRRAAERAAERTQIREFESGLWPIEFRMQILRDVCRQALHCTYYQAGYKLNGNYCWRRRSFKTMDDNQLIDRTAGNTISSQSSHEPTVPQSDGRPATIAETLALLKRGRPDLLDHLRWQLRQVPQLWKHCGDLGRLTQAALARAIAGDDDLVRESIMMVADQDRQELVGDDATAAQRLLAERVVLNRMQVAMFEHLDAQNTMKLLGSRIGESVAKRLQSANHQLRESIRQLETVRGFEKEMVPQKPVVALRIFSPDQQKKTA